MFSKIKVESYPVFFAFSLPRNASRICTICLRFGGGSFSTWLNCPLLDLLSHQCSNKACANYAYEPLKSASNGRCFIVGNGDGKTASSQGFSYNHLTQIAR